MLQCFFLFNKNVTMFLIIIFWLLLGVIIDAAVQRDVQLGNKLREAEQIQTCWL